MSRARERQLKRRERRTEQPRSSRRDQRAQVALPEQPARFRLPKIRLPTSELGRIALVAAALAFVLIVINLLGLINPLENPRLGNAIWLDRRWSYVEPEDAALDQLVERLQNHSIDHIYIFLSSLKADGTWAGLPGERDRFAEVEPLVRDLTQRIAQRYPEAQLYAWVEVVTLTSDGDRLANAQVQRTVAEFSARALRTLPVTGVMLDIKPVFNDSNDYLALLREVRSEIGIETPLAVAAAPDLTPTEANITLPSQIAPDTGWTEEFKQRVALQADYLVVSAYNSYLTEPVNYIDWVTWQVRSFTSAIAQVNGSARVLISIPNYANNPPAHDARIESIPAALDGVNRALPQLSPEQAALFQGVALFTDRELEDDDWRAYSQRWPRE